MLTGVALATAVPGEANKLIILRITSVMNHVGAKNFVRMNNYDIPLSHCNLTVPLYS
jgi:hypothetical protein